MVKGILSCLLTGHTFSLQMFRSQRVEQPDGSTVLRLCISPSSYQWKVFPKSRMNKGSFVEYCSNM